MAGREMKTKATEVSVAEFIATVADPVRRADAEALVSLMTQITGEPAVMWGPSIVGFGRYRYGPKRDRAMCRLGFSPRKAQTVLYVLLGFAGQNEMLARLGRHSHGKGCLYVPKLAGVDMAVLEQLIAAAWAHMHKRFPD